MFSKIIISLNTFHYFILSFYLGLDNTNISALYQTFVVTGAIVLVTEDLFPYKHLICGWKMVPGKKGKREAPKHLTVLKVSSTVFSLKKTTGK